VQTAIYYLLYIDPKYRSKIKEADPLEKYFETHYFSRKKFLINFLSRNQGMRWNGRFRRVFKNNIREDFLFSLTKNLKNTTNNQEDSSKKENVEDIVKRKEQKEIKKFTKIVKKESNKVKTDHIKESLDKIFDPIIKSHISIPSQIKFDSSQPNNSNKRKLKKKSFSERHLREKHNQKLIKQNKLHYVSKEETTNQLAKMNYYFNTTSKQ
jgi:hypothetical protein